MHAIDMLEEQHRHVEQLFHEFGATDDPATRQRIVGELVSSLRVHSEIEEQIFYPAVLEKLPEMGEEIREDLEEHLVVARQLEDLEQADPGDERYASKVEVTAEIVTHHVEEEEGDLFPELRDALDESLFLELGQRMDVLSRQLRMSRDELLAEARAAGLTGVSSMTKEQLARAIVEHG
jgi:hemerythrin superfamily protein